MINPLSIFAFNFNWHRYSAAAGRWWPSPGGPPPDKHTGVRWWDERGGAPSATASGGATAPSSAAAVAAAEEAGAEVAALGVASQAAAAAASAFGIQTVMGEQVVVDTSTRNAALRVVGIAVASGLRPPPGDGDGDFRSPPGTAAAVAAAGAGATGLSAAAGGGAAAAAGTAGAGAGAVAAAGAGAGAAGAEAAAEAGVVRAQALLPAALPSYARPPTVAVSVVITTYNRGELLRVAVASVAAQDFPAVGRCRLTQYLPRVDRAWCQQLKLRYDDRFQTLLSTCAAITRAPWSSLFWTTAAPTPPCLRSSTRWRQNLGSRRAGGGCCGSRTGIWAGAYTGSRFSSTWALLSTV